ncbi:VanZ family protein [Peribacillus simplex]|uniref:VanZ family protein n=1 Tax=Peribacillus simplex TaxID=1478 RepID=UPI00367005C3
MKKIIIQDIIIPALFASYIFLLSKVILFKFGHIDITFLLEQLQSNLQNPTNMKDRLLLFGNFIPFNEIVNTVQNRTNHNIFNLLGNIALFIPIGIFLPLFIGKGYINLKRVCCISFIVSLCFEISQAVFNIGIFDVDDLLLNPFGGMLGYALFKFFGIKSKNHQVLL